MSLKQYRLSLTRNYVSSWGMKQAVREILQNALDSGSPFIYNFSPQDDGTFALQIKSEYSRLEPRTLLLGATSKANDGDAIGQFGEGYKLAMLVLMRDEYGIEIYNNELYWKPDFERDDTFGEDVLVVNETERGDKHKASGVEFVISRLTSMDCDAIREGCLNMQQNIGAMRRTKYGDILTHRPGKLYVGGLFVCDTDMTYGYNIRPEFMKLERDRETVAGWHLKEVTQKMWENTEEWDEIAIMIEKELSDVENMRWGSDAQVKNACFKLFKKKNPGKVIAKDNAEMERLVMSGLTVYVGNDNFYSNVTRHHSYRTEFKQAFVEAKSPHAFLAEFLKDNRSEMKRKAIVAAKKLLEESAKWKTK